MEANPTNELPLKSLTFSIFSKIDIISHNDHISVMKPKRSQIIFKMFNWSAVPKVIKDLFNTWDDKKQMNRKDEVPDWSIKPKTISHDK